MKKLRVVINVEKEGRLDAYLELMNSIMKLTGTQLKVLTELVRENPRVCTPQIRHNVTRKMGFKSITVTNNFIKVLRDKGILNRNKLLKTYEYNKAIIPAGEVESVEFVFPKVQETQA